MAQHGCFQFFCFFLYFVWVGGRHECERPCLGSEQPRTCFYRFDVGVSQRKNGQGLFLSINGKSPSPMISICKNDTVVVDVRNNLPWGLETSLHWHGASGGDFPFMDGVPMVTQCPILPRTGFRYRMRASQSGTFYYHAHSVAQQLDGVHGPLIVHDANVQEYPSRTVVVSPEMDNLQVLERGLEADLNVSALRLEVFSHTVRHDKDKEKAPVRLRIINAAALDCPLRIFTHIVPLKVVATDGNDIKPAGVDEIVVGPGERVDLLVKPEVMKVTHVVGQNLCQGHAKYGFYPGVSEKTDSKPGRPFGLHKLKSEPPANLERSDVNVFLPYDLSLYQNFNGVVDFRYKLGALTPYAPSVLSSSRAAMFEIRNKSFLYPPSPILSQPDDVPEDLVCDPENFSDRCLSNDNGFCECLQILNLPYNKNVDLFVIDEGKNGNASQTIHIHGHSFFVLSIESFDKPISAAELKEKEARGEIKRNLVNSIRKDTILVPNKGYVVLRLKTNSPGKWLLESTTSKAKTGFGLEIVLNVEDPGGQQAPPRGFPACGTMKEPDLVFGVD